MTMRLVFERDYPRDTAMELAADLSPSRPGTIWSVDILFGVAQLSAEHAERIGSYLGWSRARLAEEIASFREDPRGYIKRSKRASPAGGSDE
jgi:hypothetical protein